VKRKHRRAVILHLSTDDNDDGNCELFLALDAAKEVQVDYIAITMTFAQRWLVGKGFFF
jgi:hypothetical protein